MFGLGVPELLIILVIVIVVFGANRLKGVGGALGTSIRDFKKTVRDDDTVPSGRTETITTTETKLRDDSTRDSQIR
ncbi:MAG: twin-arginine translocase TatA/TatE family subunit [Herpetosiphonaceae bacterium]|nr:twin-arginine translocase TatA/TatE family subunit [Herpetosiphonaceae bacterium]